MPCNPVLDSAHVKLSCALDRVLSVSPGCGHASYCHRPCAAGEVRQTLMSHSAPPTLLSDWSSLAEMTRCRTFHSLCTCPSPVTQLSIHNFGHNLLLLLGKLRLPQRSPLMKTSSTGQAKLLGCNGVVLNPHPNSPSMKICLWRYKNTESNRAPMPPLPSSDVWGHHVDFCTQTAFGSKQGSLFCPSVSWGQGRGSHFRRPWLWGCSC